MAAAGAGMTAPIIIAQHTLLGVKVLVLYAEEKSPVCLHNVHQFYYSVQRRNVESWRKGKNGTQKEPGLKSTAYSSLLLLMFAIFPRGKVRYCINK